MSNNIYNFKSVEKKWNKFFESYTLSNDEIKKSSKKSCYILVMLPYPSGKLHMGHIRNYTIGDALARYKKMIGLNVIHPMGWDSFGMPAENAALQSNGHPKAWTENNIQSMKSELKSMGYMYDWDREISTCSTDYYSKEQSIFLDLYKKGLVHKKKSFVNWDPVDQTVLANEQVIDGKGWRSGAIVEKKTLEQWSVKITDYAEELLEGLKDLEGSWPEKVIKMQENWIGKSEGTFIDFEIINSDDNPLNNSEFKEIKVFTTRPDTLFGASFMAISPDHEISQNLAKNSKEISDFINECKKIGTNEESIEKAEKKGIFTGIYVKHPLIESEKLPVYIANFVLIEYGTGAVFACPAHDERDFDFAKKYNLKIKRVINPPEDFPEDLAYTGDGKHINSDFLDGMNVKDAKDFMIKHLEKLKIGEKKTIYRLRDWLVSRQRYWGCPIPIIYCEKCGVVPAELPVILPDDVNFDGKGNPLEKHPTWKHTKCPKCGDDAIRDTDTLDTFFESSWYFLRYLDAKCKDPINKEISDLAMPVDLCIGGIEHAVMHLLYARFFMLALRDMGYLSSKIPFKALLTQGMVCHKSYKNSDDNWVYPSEVSHDKNKNLVDSNGKLVTEYSSEKMSKSKKNTIGPDEIINSHGADAIRLFILSDTPPEKDFDWNTDALDGSWRFLNRIWKLFNKVKDIIKENRNGDDYLIKTTHVYLKRITESYESISLNKTVALIRELFNEIEAKINTESSKSIDFAFRSFVKAISPIIPFITHEIWENLAKSEHLQNTNWPEIDEKLATLETSIIAVQVNGKLRGTFEIAKGSDDRDLENNAYEIIKESISKDQIKKAIIVKDRIVNFVT